MEFGIFNSFWDGRPNHLPFLQLNEDVEPTIDEIYTNSRINWPDGIPLPEPIPPEKRISLEISTSLLRSIINKSNIELLESGLESLLLSPDWRPHLVAAIAVCFINKIHNRNMSNRLWDRLGKGSWVSPQICVVLSKINGHFTEHADQIIKYGIIIKYEDNLASVEAHSFLGPGGKDAESRKYLQALEYLTVGKINNEIDDYNGGKIAQRWKVNFDRFYTTKILKEEI
jgi:hypothetical protein